MARQLTCWNGAGSHCRNDSDPLWAGVRANASTHAYVAAHSRADAAKIVSQYLGRDYPAAMLRDFWLSGWGNALTGISPERGLWLDIGKGPVRVV